MSGVYRAPMRSRDDAIDVQATIARALSAGVVGFGEADVDADRLARRIERFTAIDDGAYVWTRDTDGLYWLGRVHGPYSYDRAGAGVDLVHVRPCRWAPRPLSEAKIPAAVAQTFGRGGRNFQQTHGRDVVHETARIWTRMSENA